MSKKLGEMLVEDGRLTEAQLQKALKAQLIFGGHLGTSLIELGYLDEDTLGETLARAFNVPYASVEILHAVQYSVVRAIPAKLVEKYKVVPIRLDGKVLQLAMLDPKNLMALDEISFVTGYKIDPWVSPEIRIFQALEKYYNIPRSQRYVTLARELGKLRSRGRKVPAGEDPISEELPSPVAAPAASPDGEDTSPMAPVPASLPVPGAPPPPGAASVHSGTQPRPSPQIDHWEKYGYGKSWREFADAMERKAVSSATSTILSETPPQRTAGPGKPGGREAAPERDLAEVSRRLAECATPEEVADIVMHYVSRRLQRSALFILRGDHAVGWDGAGEGFTSAIKGLNVPLERDSLFSLLDEGRRYFHGNLPTFPSIRRFFQNLNVSMPRMAFLAPIMVRDRIASVIYGDGGPESDLHGIDVGEIERLAHKASLALQMIILRNKILTT